MKNLWQLNNSGDAHAANMQAACVDQSHQYAGAATNGILASARYCRTISGNVSVLLVSQIQYDNVKRWSSIMMRTLTLRYSTCNLKRPGGSDDVIWPEFSSSGPSLQDIPEPFLTPFGNFGLYAGTELEGRPRSNSIHLCKLGSTRKCITVFKGTCICYGYTY